jgi:GNAT superfamily N-acetyltransferase
MRKGSADEQTIPHFQGYGRRAGKGKENRQPDEYESLGPAQWLAAKGGFATAGRPDHPRRMLVREKVQNEKANRHDVMPEHMLDNPIWSALTTDHADLALGSGGARRYPPEIGPLSGMPEQTDGGYAALRELTAPGGMAALFLCEAPKPPMGWTLARHGGLVQMTAGGPVATRVETEGDAPMRRLTAEDAPAMVELATLTEPGPFRLRTMELGMFFGIEQEGRLVAMAGQRTRMAGFVEVSGVCTHPEARGRGYAQRLMLRVMEEIVREGRVPYLHALAENPAIRIYEKLGFTYRRSFDLAVVQREG